MDSDEELDFILITAILMKKRKRRKKSKIWVQEIYKSRTQFGIKNLANEMKLTNREPYFK